MGAFMKFFLLLSLFIPGLANALESNSIEDSFAVKSIKGQQAIVEGKVKNLKAGDLLYFSRSPFKFTIESIAGNQITVAIPAVSDLKVGQGLVRNPTESILKSIDTEKKLKNALED